MRALTLLATVSMIGLSSPAYAQLVNVSQVSQTGTSNQANIDNNTVGNSANSSTVIQNGFSNSASVYQRQNFNRSYIEQIGNLHSAVNQQVGNFNRVESRQSGDTHESAMTQIGNSNTATLIQSGYANRSTLYQGYERDSSFPGGDLRSADNNQASIDQAGSGLVVRIAQRGASASALSASANIATIVQRSSTALGVDRQNASITQESSGNTATISQTGGEQVGLSAQVSQRSTTSTASDPVGNDAHIEQAGQNALSSINQDGYQNAAAVRMLGGQTTNDDNQATVTQTGRGLVSAITVQSGRGLGGTSNRSSVSQSGVNHSATLFQFGVGGSTTVVQTGDNPTSSVSTTDLLANLFVSQNAFQSSSDVHQSGDGLVDITQGFGSSSITKVDQRNAGDYAAEAGSNSAIVAQYGDNNVADVGQDTIGGTATIWQKTVSQQNTAVVRQGTGSTGQAPTSETVGFPMGATADGSEALRAEITQAGQWNRAVVHQDGKNLTATVSQSGQGSSERLNRIFVSQTGSGNFASATQSSGVGSSQAGDPGSGNSALQNSVGSTTGVQDEFYFSGGSRSAEIYILQTNTANSASVAQFGKGQVARIEQSGPNNLADIVQLAGATNATAVIRQAGSGNSYSVIQEIAGAYIVVSQTGTNNAVTSVVKRP